MSAGITWDEFKKRQFVVYDCPTWDEWVEIKKAHGLGPHEGGLHAFASAAGGLETPSGKIEFVSSRIAALDPDNAERPPLARWLLHAESPASPRSRAYPLAVVSNHPRFRFHVQGDDIDWIREIGKVRGPDGYLYEPCWIHPRDAAPRAISNGDVVMVHNERGGVLAGAVVTERIIPGAVSIEHGAKIDPVMLRSETVDRGGSINLIAPSPQEKYGAKGEVTIPEMNVSAFLAQVVKVDVAEIAAPPAQG